ncbi:MAG: tetratricopeptide repeat protein [Lutibacter sp.]|uniref:tetratricopeptide repeat protein n=1 Tax=Lutibacter sp. TaxID=1925666 RepID=UPI00179D4719|nr:tetratricopeptide repeat protein [Lutibacter sp.]MBT8318233.1 tetratricopeptide repeat protein [Lutibacter sp.]NNJ59092.1 tetratricopeptide repeat protein [Lutibacter sp.]
MRVILIILIGFFSLQIYAQEPQLAYQYFRNGEYEKAASIYKELHEKHAYNTTYFKYLIDCYLQLENFEEIPKIITKQLENFPNQEYLYVELGYCYQLQHLNEKATYFYQKALIAIEKTPNLGYLVGKAFQDNHLLDYSLLAYKKGMELNPNTNYNFQIAFIYGEKGEIENMFTTYLDLIASSENYFSTSKTYIGKFITEDPESEYNISLKRLLLKRLQNNPQNSWNELLSWLFIQQKEYSKALIQEKALFKRNSSSLSGILEVGKIAFNNKDFEASKNSFQYVLENNTNINDELVAKLFLLEIDMKTNASVETIDAQFQELFTQYGKSINTLKIQAIYAEFLAFKKNDSKEAISILKKALKLPINEFQKGELKIKLADILVFTNKFSSALIYYTQVQNSLKNHTIGQTARFKIAQTSYFKGDFKWAQSQLKVLKNSTSQLIANDALDLNLLITDNAVKDSLKLALKTYAKAELLSYQKKNIQAIDTLQTLINTYKGHPIEDEALFKQAQLFEKTNMFEMAMNNYFQIITINKDDILADDANYYLAELYLNKLNNIEKAKEYYQKIIFDYPSSIYLVDARKKYRKLRGDEIN